MAAVQPVFLPFRSTSRTLSRVAHGALLRRAAMFTPAICQNGLTFRRARSDARAMAARAIPSPAVKLKAPRLSDLNMGDNFDGGFLPQTLIPPTGKNKPSFLSSPKLRLRFTYELLKFRLQSLYTRLIFRNMQKNKKKRTSLFKLFSKEAVPAAVQLHKEMYEALAAGNIGKLQRICCQGLADDLVTRAQTQDRLVTRTWRVDKVLSRPKLVSDRASQTPVGGTGIRQAVVRLHTRQVLEKNRAGIITNRQEQDSLEYLVVQKMFVHGEEGDWKVWGTVKETDFEVYMEELRFPLQAMKAMQQRAQMR